MCGQAPKSSTWMLDTLARMFYIKNCSGTPSKYCDLFGIRFLFKFFRSCIAENFERAKMKYDPSLIGDVTPPTVTFDELYIRYKERDRSGESVKT